MTQPSWIGRTLSNRYRIDAMLGQGGMSAVYKATDPNLKRVVAIKLIHAHLSDDVMFIKRFEEEAAAVASLRHPNIVQVFDFNVDNGVYYMVLEFIPGETLQDRLRRLNQPGRLLPIQDALKFTINICDALQYAHQRGMVHRDIKPANIMLDIHNQSILMDFGIVKIVGGDSHTATGAVVGTARYMSPEVIRAEVPDGRADIYSLGVTLFEMLSGRPPYMADSAMTLMMMHLNDPVPDPRTLRAEVPQQVVDILIKAMAKDREARYHSAAEFAAALKSALALVNDGSATGVETQSPAASTAAPVSAAAPPTAAEPLPAPAFTDSGISAPQPQPAPVSTPPVTPPAPVASYPTQYNAAPVTPPPPSAQYTPPPAYTPPPPSAQYPSPAAAPKKGFPVTWIAGIALLVIVCLAVVGGGGAMLASQFLNPGSPTAAVDTLSTAAAQTVAAAQAAATQPTWTPAPSTSTIEPTWTPEPPTWTPEPTPTYPPLYVRINSITLNAAYQYVVEYETFGFTEKLPGQHIHFFFNTVAPDQAGVPGNGPWKIYGGPRPFTGYILDNKPAAATQMCALVANANHTVIAESGNCVNLP